MIAGCPTDCFTSSAAIFSHFSHFSTKTEKVLPLPHQHSSAMPTFCPLVIAGHINNTADYALAMLTSGHDPPPMAVHRLYRLGTLRPSIYPALRQYSAPHLTAKQRCSTAAPPLQNRWRHLPGPWQALDAMRDFTSCIRFPALARVFSTRYRDTEAFWGISIATLSISVVS